MFSKVDERDEFLKSFSTSKISKNDIVNASNDINLQSIRVHKFLTSTGEIGKVATAKFLSSINEGDSISINGVCLTAYNISNENFSVDISNETLDVKTKYSC